MYGKILKMNDIPEKLYNVGEKHFFKKNDIIINHGELINHVYILVRGKVLVYFNAIKGLMYYDLILPPSLFGESYVIRKKEINGSFKCLEDSEVIMIHRDTLLDLMKTDFDINIYIYNITASKYGVAGWKAEEYATLSSEDKIIFFLINLAEHVGIKHNDKIKIDLNISQQFISNFASVERTSTVRTFNKLKAKQILEYYDGHYYINDLESLKKMMYKNT